MLLGVDHAFVFEHLQVRVDGTRTGSPESTAHLLQPTHNLIAMGRVLLQRGQDGASDVTSTHSSTAAPVGAISAPTAASAVHVVVFVMPMRSAHAAPIAW
jgi:hypothetical protein